MSSPSRFAGLPQALKACSKNSTGSSTRLAAFREAKERGENVILTADLVADFKAEKQARIEARRRELAGAEATTLPPAASVKPAPAKAKAAAPAKHQAKPAAKISDEQLRLNMRSFAVLSQPNAEGKGHAVMAMLNADATMTAPQAIARLDALPFDDPNRQAAAKAKASSDAWDAAYASLSPNTGNAPEASDCANPATTAKPSTREAEISTMWDRAYASVFGTAQASDSPQSASKPQSASEMWDRVYAELSPNSAA